MFELTPSPWKLNVSLHFSKLILTATFSWQNTFSKGWLELIYGGSQQYCWAAFLQLKMNKLKNMRSLQGVFVDLFLSFCPLPSLRQQPGVIPKKCWSASCSLSLQAQIRFSKLWGSQWQMLGVSWQALRGVYSIQEAEVISCILGRKCWDVDGRKPGSKAVNGLGWSLSETWVFTWALYHQLSCTEFSW